MARKKKLRSAASALRMACAAIRIRSYGLGPKVALSCVQGRSALVRVSAAGTEGIGTR